MTPEMERKWALAKAGILKTQAAYMTIVLNRCTTHEELRAAVEKNKNELEALAQQFEREAERHEPNRN